MNITILFDNYPYKEGLAPLDSKLLTGLETGWGFSCLLKGLEKTILFDTGADGRVLLSNMEKLGIEPKSIDTIFLSHEHWDHTGGLTTLLNKRSDYFIYLPKSFSTGFKSSVREYGAKIVDVDKSVEICKDAYSTGEMGVSLKEQSLIVKTAHGLIGITGCAHPGIVNILKKIKQLFTEEIYLIMGGFHLGGYSDKELKEIVKEFKTMGVMKTAPSHCSGDRCMKLFKEEYGDNFVELGVGINLSTDCTDFTE